MSHTFRVQISVNAPKQRSWQLLADYGGVDKYIEGVLNSHLTTDLKQGIGCTRHCDLPKMMTMDQYIVEEVIDWVDGESLTYVVTDTNSPITDGKVKWWVTGDETNSIINADVFYKPRGIMGMIMSPMLRKIFPEQLNLGLSDMKKYLELNSDA